MSTTAEPTAPKVVTAAGGGKSMSKTPGKPAEPEPSPVSYFGLWRFATPLDVLFAVLGFFAGVGNGIVFPLFTLVRSGRCDGAAHHGGASALGWRSLYRSRCLSSPPLPRILPLSLSLSPLPSQVMAGLLDSFWVADIQTTVAKYALYMLWLAIAAGGLSLAQVSLAIVAAERQGLRIRAAYMSAVMRQEMAVRKGCVGDSK